MVDESTYSADQLIWKTIGAEFVKENLPIAEPGVWRRAHLLYILDDYARYRVNDHAPKTNQVVKSWFVILKRDEGCFIMTRIDDGVSDTSDPSICGSKSCKHENSS